MSNEEAPICACGVCGKRVTWNKKKKHWNYKLRGHHRIGIIQTEEERKNNSEANRFVHDLKRHGIQIPKNPSDEWIIEMRALGEAPFCKCGCGEKVSLSGNTKWFKTWNEYILGHNSRGKEVSQETIVKRRETLKQNHPTRVPPPSEEAPICACGACGRQVTWNNAKWRWNYKLPGHNMRGRIVTEETRRKQSEATKRKHLNREYNWKYGDYLSKKTGVLNHYRSSDELQFMQELDNDPDILWWENEPFAMPYDLNGEYHQYIPDFLVTSTTRSFIVEVKPINMRSSIEMNVAKRNAIKRLCSIMDWDYGEWSKEDNILNYTHIQKGEEFIPEEWIPRPRNTREETRLRLSKSLQKYYQQNPDVGRARLKHAGAARTSESFRKGAKKLKETLAAMRIQEPDPDAPLCQCGCGRKVSWSNSKKRWNFYVYGHKSLSCAIDIL